MKVRHAWIILVAAGAAFGCDASAPLGPDGPLFNNGKGGGKGGGGGSTTSDVIQVRLDWDDHLVVDVGGAATPAGVRGDGRDATGAVGSSAYQDGLCGVSAIVRTGSRSGGELAFDAYSADGCDDLRVHHFYMDGAGSAPHTAATKTIAPGLWWMQVHETNEHSEGFHVGLPQCSRVMYSAALGTDDPRRTRLADVDGARQWRIESQGSHRAVCVYTARGKEQVGQVSAPMPFAFTVTEVLP
jgi:hypothetical protein